MLPGVRGLAGYANTSKHGKGRFVVSALGIASDKFART
jgi:D-alanyl-D-alanine carboxypeptidase